MATRYDVLSRNDQQPQWMTSNIHLSAPELHDFSDLRSTDGQPKHMLRWVIAIATVLIVSHFVFNPLGVAPATQASISATSITTSL